MKKPEEMTLEELKEATRAILHRMPKAMAEAVELAMEEGRNIEVAEILEDHAANLGKRTS